MKYCVSGRQPYSVLKQADEVRVAYVDKDRIMDFVEQIPDKRVILELDSQIAPIEEKVWAMYQEKFEHFCVATNSLHMAKEMNEANIPWYVVRRSAKGQILLLMYDRMRRRNLSHYSRRTTLESQSDGRT